MFTVIPRHYHSPKWQAAVSPDQAFVFKDGTRVRTILELKQALMTLPEDVVIYHVDPNRHDIANWLRDVVKDGLLAEAMSKQFHRWGLIVALERHLMRTLNLPPYVALRWLQSTSTPFTFSSGDTAYSLEELKNILSTLSDDVIKPHLERTPNDFSVWVKEIIGDYELADILSDATNRSHLIQILSDHLAMLKDAAN